jgi:hypothetical protein
VRQYVLQEANHPLALERAVWRMLQELAGTRDRVEAWNYDRYGVGSTMVWSVLRLLHNVPGLI